MTLLAVFDVLLAMGLTLRLVRLVVTDDLGKWFIRTPTMKWAVGREKGIWRVHLVDGLTCPFCVGFWIGCLVLLSLFLCGGPGNAADAWRWVAGAFTLNWIAAHVGSRLD